MIKTLQKPDKNQVLAKYGGAAKIRELPLLDANPEKSRLEVTAKVAIEIRHHRQARSCAERALMLASDGKSGLSIGDAYKIAERLVRTYHTGYQDFYQIAMQQEERLLGLKEMTPGEIAELRHFVLGKGIEVSLEGATCKAESVAWFAAKYPSKYALVSGTLGKKDWSFARVDPAKVSLFIDYYEAQMKKDYYKMILVGKELVRCTFNIFKYSHEELADIVLNERLAYERGMLLPERVRIVKEWPDSLILAFQLLRKEDARDFVGYYHREEAVRRGLIKPDYKPTSPGAMQFSRKYLNEQTRGGSV